MLYQVFIIAQRTKEEEEERYSHFKWRNDSAKLDKEVHEKGEQEMQEKEKTQVVSKLRRMEA